MNVQEAVMRLQQDTENRIAIAMKELDTIAPGWKDDKG